MAFTDLIPWNRNRNIPAQRQTDEHPLFALRREMDRMFDNFFRDFDVPMAGTPAGLVAGGRMSRSARPTTM